MQQGVIFIFLLWRSCSGNLGTRRFTVRVIYYCPYLPGSLSRADLDPSCESTGSPHLRANDHRPLLALRAHAFARVCAWGDQEGVHSTLLRRVSGGRGCRGPASAHRRSPDGIEHRASGRQSTYQSPLEVGSQNVNLLFRQAGENGVQAAAL
jgi:hypothetical protein